MFIYRLDGGPFLTISEWPLWLRLSYWVGKLPESPPFLP